MSAAPLLFDRLLVRRRRTAATHALLDEARSRLGERLEDFRRHFPAALDLGARAGVLPKTGHVVRCGFSAAAQSQTGEPRVAGDEENLPFAPESFDLIVSLFSLHWVNDLPGALIQIRRALKPDGLFMAMLPGPGTLQELRASLAQAEMEVEGGVSPRVSPFVDVRDAGSLLQRAGFATPVADSETLTMDYEHPLHLLHDLRHVGETNALLQRKKSLRRATLARAMEYYRQRFACGDGVAATLEIVTLTGWAKTLSS